MSSKKEFAENAKLVAQYLTPLSPPNGSMRALVKYSPGAIEPYYSDTNERQFILNIYPEDYIKVLAPHKNPDITLNLHACYIIPDTEIKNNNLIQEYQLLGNKLPSL